MSMFQSSLFLFSTSSPGSCHVSTTVTSDRLAYIQLLESPIMLLEAPTMHLKLDTMHLELNTMHLWTATMLQSPLINRNPGERLP